jgi:para-aminobenzoate synthetase / 4-amino-4-deoxychorismate lyase
VTREDGQMFEGSSSVRLDPRLGVFETMLVADGRPIELRRHLKRLEASVDRLYDAVLPPGLEADVAAAAAPLRLGRLRLTAAPGGVSLQTTLAADPLDPALVFPASGAALRSREVSGGLGPDKLVDRPLGNRPAAGPGALVVDRGEALETAWANIFVVADGVLRTPRSDGRVLPGVTRAAVIELAREAGAQVMEAPVEVDRLAAAEEVFLTNSIRGVEPAVVLDGAELRGAGPLSRRLAAALRERWRLPVPDRVPAMPAAAPQPGPPAR